ncbi:hypothetical protein J6590_031894 [Homalodisca vitripennis]|nr:hypothetical protein J6590_031894 [Homalodisca vitripennis]
MLLHNRVILHYHQRQLLRADHSADTSRIMASSEEKGRRLPEEGVNNPGEGRGSGGGKIVAPLTWLLLGWVTAERSNLCKQPATGGSSEVTFKPLNPEAIRHYRAVTIRLGARGKRLLELATYHYILDKFYRCKKCSNEGINNDKSI